MQPLRMTGHDEHGPQDAEPDRRGPESAKRHGAIEPWRTHSFIAGKQEKEQREQDQHGHQIENPLDNDRRESRRREGGPLLWPASTGRNTSPARAGSTNDAANPITVVRNATRKCVLPSGSRRYCQRSARTKYVVAVSTRLRASMSGRADRISLHTRARSALRRKIASRPIASPTTRIVRSTCAQIGLHPSVRSSS